MKRIKQLIKHDPDNGKWGDCYRTCVAMAMGMEPEHVPHFCDGGDRSGIDGCRKWLSGQGLGLWRAFYPGEYSFSDILVTFGLYSEGVPIIMTGYGKRGVNHCVVVLDGEVFCDPATGKADPEPFLGPAQGDGESFWWAEVITKIPALSK